MTSTNPAPLAGADHGPLGGPYPSSHKGHGCSADPTARCTRCGSRCTDADDCDLLLQDRLTDHHD